MILQTNMLILVIDDLKEWWDIDHVSDRKYSVQVVIILSQTGKLREGWNGSMSAVAWPRDPESPNPSID